MSDPSDEEVPPATSFRSHQTKGGLADCRIEPRRPASRNQTYRIRVERERDRARLFSRNGHGWTDRYPWIMEAALKNRIKQFVIDGEAVVLDVDGVPISTRCTRASTTKRCSSMPSTS
jgi:hypothetical protein